MLIGPMPGASPAQKYPSTSSLVRPASSSAPRAHSACNKATDLSVALRVGCSHAPTIYPAPFKLMLHSPSGLFRLPLLLEQPVIRCHGRRLYPSVLLRLPRPARGA